MMKQFSMIPYSWYGLMRERNLNMEDVNLLGVINSLSKTRYGCIATDAYLEDLLKTPNIRHNINRLSNAGLININTGKVRKITINDKALIEI